MKTRRIVSLWMTYALLGAVFTTTAAAGELQATDIQLYCAPVLQTGAQTELTALTLSGRPLSGITIKVNDASVQTDQDGHARFIVPESNELTIGLQKQSGPGTSYTYSREGNMQVQKTMAGQLIASLHQNLPQKAKTPTILFAPATLQQGEEFVLGGVKLGSNSTDFKVIVDGSESTTLACSPLSIIARAPMKLSAAPLQDLFVSCGPSNSNAVETDICNLTIQFPEKPEKDRSPQQAKLIGSGTNMPCLVRVTNASQDAVSVWLPDQKPMGKQGLFLTPGGADNSIAFQIRRTAETTPVLIANLVGEVPPTLSQSGLVSIQTRRDLCLAQIVRLRRRYIAVEAKLEETRKQIEKSDTSSDSISSQLQFLSLRQTRLQRMIEARRAMLPVLGGTEESYRTALGKAVGTATLPLELSLQVSGSADVTSAALAIPTGTSSANEQFARKPKPRLHRNIEPSIKLLPPMDENDPGANASSAASAPTDVPPYSDGAGGLRPSLPEAPKQTEKSSPVATSTSASPSAKAPPKTDQGKKLPDSKAKESAVPKKPMPVKRKSDTSATKRRTQTPSPRRTTRPSRRSRRGR